VTTGAQSSAGDPEGVAARLAVPRERPHAWGSTITVKSLPVFSYLPAPSTIVSPGAAATIAARSVQVPAGTVQSAGLPDVSPVVSTVNVSAAAAGASRARMAGDVERARGARMPP
jgi:hypothetical protein